MPRSWTDRRPDRSAGNRRQAHDETATSVPCSSTRPRCTVVGVVVAGEHDVVLGVPSRSTRRRRSWVAVGRQLDDPPALGAVAARRS